MVNHIKWFFEITIDDVPLVGGKNASLGEMYRELTPQGIRIPNGFAVTSEAYRYVMDQANAWEPLHEALDDLDPNDMLDLAKRAHRAREIVYAAPFPDDLREQILASCAKLKEQYGDDTSVAVRSSATAEDLPTASFAGQQDTYLNIRPDRSIIHFCQRCFASLFTDRAIHYRVDHGFDHFKLALSVGIMKMVRSDLASSGVMFSLDTESGFKDVVYITGAYGLGENVVQGAVDPDEFYVHKPTFMKGYRKVLKHSLGTKKIKMVYADTWGTASTKNVHTSFHDQNRFCLNDEDVLTLANCAIKIEKHYSKKAGRSKPMDMEWAKDGIDGALYIVQARPETVVSQKSGMILEQYELKEKTAKSVVTGHAVGSKIAAGPVRIMGNVRQLSDFKKGDVLVADMTTPDWEPVMKIASAIVTNQGGRTCHAAIISRELGVPAVIGCENATTALRNSKQVTVSCAEGDKGKVYEGILPFEVITTDLSHLGRPKTHIMLNLGNPELAFKTSFLPNDGVGLARMEFIITEYIKAHPMALIHSEKVQDESEKKELALLVKNQLPEEFFIERLAEGVGTIAAAFYPKPVVVRMSDFKTNEYATLLGGRWFEFDEANPMIGFRGASRYTHSAYAEAFALECAAMKRVRNDMGLTNVILMIPFCRRIREAERVLEYMAELGLRRGENGLQVYVMCEIPNNVIQIDEFSKYFDGFSIGSNDLTQLTLGADRDSAIIAESFDEQDPGVKEMIRFAVAGAKRNGKHSGLCGQAPSDYPDMAEFLVEIGIDSMSVTPDTVLKITERVLEVEKKLGR